MTGIETYKELQAQNPLLYGIMLSGTAFPEVIEEAKKAGISEVMWKPCQDADGLMKNISDSIQRVMYNQTYNVQ